MKPSHFLAGAVIAVVIQVAAGYWLFQWTMEDFRPVSILRMQMDPVGERRRIEELEAKPFRPWARLSMSSILAVGTLVLDAYVVFRMASLVED